MDDELLLDLPHPPAQHPKAHPDSFTAIVPEAVCKLFEEYRQKLISDVSQQNEAYLTQLHQYYSAVIAQLNNKIRQLQAQLAASHQQPSESHSTPEKPTREEDNPSPITIDLQMEEESLLDNLTNHHHPDYTTPKLVESFIFQTVEQAALHTKKKEPPSIQPAQLLGEEFAEEGLSIKYHPAGLFERELKAIKEELVLLRSHLVKDGANPEYAKRKEEELAPDIRIKLLQVEQSRQAKQHLANQNIELRKQIELYRRQLSVLAQELHSLRQQLARTLDGQGND